MIRICTSLSNAGFDILLVGRKLKSSIPLISQPFRQKRLQCIFNKGPWFYAEYNLKLFFFLLFKRMDGICAIDLDTILPCYFISILKRKKRIYDAHELFCEMKEVRSRPHVYRIWKWIERNTVPRFKKGYTVNGPIAEEFRKMYNVNMEVIRSISVYEPFDKEAKENFIIYQGAVNEGRSFETLIPAMRLIDVPLRIYGDGNFMEKAKQLAVDNNVTPKVSFLGMVTPEELKKNSRKALIGITIFEKDSLSNYYSLANRFFDYIHAGVPQICMDYPVYREINNQYNIALLIDDLAANNIAKAVNELITDSKKRELLEANCREAAKVLNWQTEEKKLVAFYKQLFG
jgi:glycosyltransferase involved in cell wall biosynthesis